MATAYRIPGMSITLQASAELEAHKAVVVNSSGLAAAAGAGVVIAGVVQAPVNKDEAATVMAAGITYAIFGGVVAAGDSVSTDANGEFVKATDGVVCGIALVGGAKGATGSILLK